MSVTIAEYVAAIPGTMLARFAGERPWVVTASLADILTDLLNDLPDSYVLDGDAAIHETATVERGAVLKGPAIIGPRAFVAASAYLRGGVFLDAGCVVGPGCEAKSTVLFAGSRIAHLGFVGDSILGADVNCEAGSVVANHRNERADKRIRIRHAGGVIDTGVERFGAILGDGARLGANAVVAPGALLAPGTVVARLALVDQSP
ncbi:MAG: hypothetical protein IT561_27265 [Alphaproteobacteria bacterium]|nr:hypothetical protein [Alphaproteobacteria bacterium]